MPALVNPGNWDTASDTSWDLRSTEDSQINRSIPDRRGLDRTSGATHQRINSATFVNDKKVRPKKSQRADQFSRTSGEPVLRDEVSRLSSARWVQDPEYVRDVGSGEPEVDGLDARRSFVSFHLPIVYVQFRD